MKPPRVPNPATFRRTLESTTRAISKQERLHIVFGKAAPAPPSSKQPHPEDVLHLPELPQAKPLNAQQQALYRAQANRAAFVRRYSKDGAHGRRGESGGDASNTELFKWLSSLPVVAAWACKVLMMQRYEQRGRKDFSGTAEDLAHLAEAEARSAFHLQHPDMKAAFALMLEARRQEGTPLQERQQAFLEQYKTLLTPPLLEWLRLWKKSNIDDIKAYEDLLELLKLLNKHDQEEASDTPNAPPPGSPMPPLMRQLHEQMQSSPSPQTQEEAQTSDDTQADDTKEEHPPPRTTARVSDDYPSYHVFSGQFDKTLIARQLFSESEQAHLHQRFRQIAASNRALARKLALKLQRLLYSQRPLGWAFDKPEGMLDGRVLAPFVANPHGYEHIFRQPKMQADMNTSVTLLVDNSGSMRGQPIELAALCADVLARTLEQCGAKCEVLGYTTLSWKGGQSRNTWLMAERPENPGRLNDVLHIIYKPFEKNWRASHKNFSLMLSDDLLKENIDGEALHWAAMRLLKRPERRKILMVISDGAPVDYATDRHNLPGLLDRHLSEVITRIERNSPIEMAAIGIGHDVRRYYTRAVTLEEPGQLAEVLLEQLAGILRK